jgi:phosphate transport system permease protein
MSGPSGDPVPVLTVKPPRPQRIHRTDYAVPSRAFGDVIFWIVCKSAALFIIALAVLLVGVLVWRAWQSIETMGIAFFTTSKWDPAPGATHRQFGSLAFVYGTVVTSLIAMALAVPLAVGTAAFLSEVAPRGLRRAGSFFVEMLAAIPSVVYGFWGLYVFAPALQSLISALGGPDQASVGLLPAGLILGFMIVPYAAAVSFDVIRSVPRAQREAAAALGATRWQTIWSVILPFARPGIVGGCFLSLGRALGETMAVTMLIGNQSHVPDFIPGDRSFFEMLSDIFFAKGNSIPSVIANEFREASYDLYLSALVELALVLLLVSVGFSALGRLLIWQVNKPTTSRHMLVALLQTPRFWKTSANPAAPPSDQKPVPMKDHVRFQLPPRTSWAPWINRLMTGGNPKEVKIGLAALLGLATLFAATAFFVPLSSIQVAVLIGLALAAALSVLATMGVLGLIQTITTVPLFLIVGYLLYRGTTALDWDFFVKLPTPIGEPGGGLANAFYGSFLMIALATAFSVPVGLLAAIYLAEYPSGRLGAIIRFIAEMLGSVPSIVIGIFGYYAIVRPLTGGFSGLAGGFSLGVMMLPIVMRASEEALKLVPASLRQASYALGAAQWQTIVRISIPAALPAIITAIFLGIARVAGETAPLLLTAANNRLWPRSIHDYTPSLPVYIYEYAIGPFEDQHRQAWAAAFVLVAAIMILNVGVRLLAGKRVIVASQAE